MARTAARPAATLSKQLQPLRKNCPACGKRMWADYDNYRTVATLDGRVGLTLHIRRCPQPTCAFYRRPYRPEAEGRYALPQHEFGLDVIALVGALRYAEHRSVPEIHQHLVGRGLSICERTVTNLLDRYDELLAVSLTDDTRLQKLLAEQGRVILAIDGLQPDVGHEVLWVLRDCLSGEVLLAKNLLSARQVDLATLLTQVRDHVVVPIVAVVSDGQTSIRKAVAKALPDVPHQLCHFHYLREAARPIYEADRHAKKELKKHVRGVRAIERTVEGRTDAEAEVIRGYCSAVRSALTDDGRPPLKASGLQLQARLSAIVTSVGVAAEKGALPPELERLQNLLDKGLTATADQWPEIQLTFGWVQQTATILANEAEAGAVEVQQRLGGLLGALTRHRQSLATLSAAVAHFVKVTKSYWSGLFHCYTVPEVPRTNNDLEQFFGRHRYHERRATGRKAASPALVLRGSARVLAAAATRHHLYTGAALASADRQRWRELRRDLETRRQRRLERTRFRRNPAVYLQALEDKLLQLSLPP